MLNLELLRKAFSEVPLPGPFRDFNSKLIRDDNNNLPGAYFPCVGNRYENYRILFYSTAQNLAGPKEKSLVNAYCKYPNEALNRLEYKWRKGEPEPPLSEKDVYENCEVGPVASGVIPALASVFLKARYNVFIDDPDQAMSYLSFSNFYKLSLFKTSVDQIKSDLNPTRDMEKADCKKYAKLMFDNYVKKELDVLRPNTVICFRGQCCDELKSALKEKSIEPFDLLEINDTAWILRGAGGKLSEGGSWFKEEALDDFKELLSILTKENRFRHSYSRKENLIKIYLKHYYRRFLTSDV